ncbi:GNAT family N-acetyltransferase [Cohnella faecalis]|uniref:GNAT family N-acetyltransferase n=1 Tax=Cohnella faecalis TaxID=2315694 RepID=A0A398CVR9_9BACL|nr:GNAT family N-acetyltransferase [Cohnella faecalis]RIE05409.1 GNAT family N-acetyltransferase [Cohnella faecalis]
MMTLRNVRENEFDDLMALWQFAFQIQMPAGASGKGARIVPCRQSLGLFDENGRLLTNLSILPLEVWIHGVRMKMRRVASVSSWPDARRQGSDQAASPCAPKKCAKRTDDQHAASVLGSLLPQIRYEC